LTKLFLSAPLGIGYDEPNMYGGHPRILTLERSGARMRRLAVLCGIARVPKKYWSEYPPAIFMEGGYGASLRAIDRHELIGFGSFSRQQIRGLPDGTAILCEVVA
jgi:hypothetical protein